MRRPLALLLALFLAAEPIMRVLFERGAFTAVDRVTVPAAGPLKFYRLVRL